MISQRKKIYKLAKKIKKTWPKNLASNLEKYWLKTLQDDQKGLISNLTLSILPKNSSNKEIKAAIYLGAASLFRWTAANLQDDVIDENKIINLPLVNICQENAKMLGLAVPITLSSYRFLSKLTIKENNAIFLEIKQPKIIPEKILSASYKSLFLLNSPLHLSIFLGWNKLDIKYLLQAGSYLLAAKQLADDLFDYQTDWQKGRRNFAHRGLKKLPQRNELPLYYKKQAQIILSLCQQCRKIIKKISPLAGKNCFQYLLKPLEINCSLGLTKINQLELVNYKYAKK